MHAPSIGMYVNTNVFISSHLVSQTQNDYLHCFIYYHYCVCLHSGDLDIGQCVIDSVEPLDSHE